MTFKNHISRLQEINCEKLNYKNKVIVCFFSVFTFCTSSFAQQTTSVDIDKKTNVINSADLASFINTFLQKNTDLRVKNSQKLFERLVIKKDTALLPLAVYKSLGFRVRDPFIKRVSEVSTRLYQEDGESALYFQILHTLEKTSALLRTTHARVENPESWFETVVQENIALDAVEVWFRMHNNELYVQQLDKLKNQVKLAGKKVKLNREEYIEREYAKLNIKNLELLADNSQLKQFLDSESAYLFVRTNERNLPKNSQPLTYNFSKLTVCQPNQALMQKGIDYLKSNYPDVLNELDSQNLRETSWRLSEASKGLSKKLLSSPNDMRLRAANYVLEDTVLKIILLLNHRRLSAYRTNKKSLYVPLAQNTQSYASESRLSELISTQNELYDLIVYDHFIASERVASINLQMYRSCISLFNDEGSDVNSFATAAEQQRFSSLTDYKSRDVTKSLENLSAKLDSSQNVTLKSPNLNLSDEKEIDPVKRAISNGDDESTPSVVKNPRVASQVKLESGSKLNLSGDSIIKATTIQAATWLKREGFNLSSYEDILNLTKGPGHTIQVVTTSSASEAAFRAKQLSKSADVKVYLSWVNNNGHIEKRYKVLMSFIDGKISDQKFEQLQQQARNLNGYVKKYKIVRSDAFSPNVQNNQKSNTFDNDLIVKEATASKHETLEKSLSLQPKQPKKIQTKSKLKGNSISFATSEQAEIWLRNAGFSLSSYNEIVELTKQRGYSIQVLTTSSPLEAAFRARQFRKFDDVKVYLSSVIVDGITEKRYKILVSFFAGKVSARKFQELQKKAQGLKGYLKRYHLIRKDLVR